jgi:HK97 family phage major capsid protein
MSEYKAELTAGLEKVSAQLDSAIGKQNAELQDSMRASKKTNDTVNALAEQFVAMNADLTKMGDTMTAFEQSTHKAEGGGAQEGMGAQFVGSDTFAEFKAGRATRASFEANTIVTGGDNSVTRHDQLPGVVPGAVRQLTVLPTVLTGQASSNIIYYSRELLWTNNAAGTGEGSSKPESALTFEEKTVPIITIPHFLKASKQALEDSTFLASYIDMRMAHGVRNKIEQQIINGDGFGSSFSGWLATGNSTATSPLLTIDIYGLASKMKYEIIAADYEADYFYMNPADWATAETTRRAAGDTAFVAQSGAVNYVNNGLTPLLWGLPVVLSNNVPVGTMVCKSVSADMYFNRHGVRVEMFEQDTDNVQKNLITIRGEARGAEAVMVPAAIRTGDITGITAS